MSGTITMGFDIISNDLTPDEREVLARMRELYKRHAGTVLDDTVVLDQLRLLRERLAEKCLPLTSRHWYTVLVCLKYSAAQIHYHATSNDPWLNAEGEMASFLDWLNNHRQILFNEDLVFEAQPLFIGLRAVNHLFGNVDNMEEPERTEIFDEIIDTVNQAVDTLLQIDRKYAQQKGITVEVNSRLDKRTLLNLLFGFCYFAAHQGKKGLIIA